ncbi:MULTISPECIES: N-acyl homoserine lactonase family protein [Microbacterium]|uniref:N-acyl homoserine lactonase family protein n=1 Tax=Microbacterium TaxID=33882 RepID=UPI00277F67F0|nr:MULTISPECIES: N-acyl homoserine lactonase family protein [Microbacterium]MDQ1075365.1 glyoxylase-like metal-dependent hydrolase (beta-lactamase superfamily II) [Microbacterium sp. SORGH_AS_0969]MDQ1115596.1 glyoxylase-like metal-dependent hydrolase (beta-lactamase superfamily II) [Microbacterium testaceum]
MSSTGSTKFASTLDTDYSIYTLEYCHGEMPHDFFGGSGVLSNKGMVRVPMLYTLLVGGEVGGKQHVALVDCGFRDDYWLERYPLWNWENPTQVLGQVGIRPEDVEIILVSHMHFDHVGNFEAFPNATLYVQFEEFTGWSAALDMANGMSSDEQKAWVFSSFDPVDLAKAAQGLAEGRIKFVHGDQEIIPGVTARLAKDTHTFGSQWFKIQTRNGPFVAAGDVVYWYSNIESMWAPGYVQGNSFNLISTYRTMQEELKNETSRIIPGHDPEYALRHNSWLSPTGNSITELNLRENEKSRRPQGAAVLLT